jgi:hypothetical protein
MNRIYLYIQMNFLSVNSTLSGIEKVINIIQIQSNLKSRFIILHQNKFN